MQYAAEEERVQLEDSHCDTTALLIPASGETTTQQLENCSL
jgi:hypothetical protein